MSNLILDAVCPINWQYPGNRGLAGWWKSPPGWSGGSRLHDLLNQNPGVRTSSPLWVSTILGNGLSFSGGSYVDFGRPASILSITTNITLAATVVPNVTTRADFYGSWGNPNYKILLSSGITGSRFSLYVPHSSFANATDTANFSVGRPYRVTGTFDGTTLWLYVMDLQSGEFRATSTSASGTLNTSPTGNWLLGRSQDASGNCVVTDADVHAVTLSQAEVYRRSVNARTGFPDALRWLKGRSMVSVADAGGGGATPWLYARRQPQIIGGGMGL